MSASPRTTLDLKGFSPENPEKIASRAIKIKDTRTDLKPILEQLDTKPVSTTTGLNEDMMQSEQCEALVSSIDRDYTFSSVSEDTKGQNDMDKEPLYREAFLGMLEELVKSFDLPPRNKTEEDALEYKRVKQIPLDWNEIVGLAKPTTVIKDLYFRSQGKDVKKADLIQSYSQMKAALKNFLANNIWWLESKSPKDLATIKEKLLSILAIIDSLKTIAARSPLMYPNRSILDQEAHTPAYIVKAAPHNQRTPAKPRQTASWSDIQQMFKPITDDAQPLPTVQENAEERERTTWFLHTSLVIRNYEELCRSLAMKPARIIERKLEKLNHGLIGKSPHTEEMEAITSLIQQQVNTAEQVKASEVDLFQAKVAVRTIIEQFHTLKQIAKRNEDLPLKINGETIAPVQASSPWEKVRSTWGKVRAWGNKAYASLSHWLKPKKKEPKETFAWLKHTAPAFRTWGFIAGLASFTSLLSGETNHKVEPQRAEAAPMTSSPELPTKMSAQAPIARQANRVDVSITEPSTPETSNLANSSIQRRLQNTFKGEASLSTFRDLYGQQFLNLSENQKNYLANTFAHVIRPHLRGFHSNMDTAPLHVTHLGPTLHHKHMFMVSSGGHTESVRVHIPSWENLSRGLQQADTATPHQNNPHTPSYTAPNDMESALASAIPPLPPGSTTDNVRNAIDIDAALDALNQADQLPPTPRATPEPPSPPSKLIPNAVAIALDELAQSDKNRNRPA